MHIVNEFTNITDLPFKKIDLFIGASGYEARSTFQAKSLSSIIKKGVVLGFKNAKEHPFRIKNDLFFQENGFEIIETDVEDLINRKLEKLFKIIEKDDQLVIYIDYSSMSKNLYSYLLFVLYHQEDNSNWKLYLGYSHAEYIKDNQDKTPNRVVAPLNGYCNLSLPTKPTSLIIGIGNELSRVFGLKEYFDAIPYIFYTDNSYNERYNLEAKELLKNMSSQIPPENIFEYPIKNLRYSYYMLKNLCDELIKNTRIIIAPCGPKPFAVLAMLLSLQYDDDIEVWRISPGNKLNAINRVATGLVSTIEIEF
tara:strand:+ start:31819 stop:32745 length:927 start_codon:yes stop_codon:yes gene_type:complete